MKPWISIWTLPETGARLMLSAAIMTAGCALFSPLVILGPYVTVNPMIGGAVFFGIQWGPAGVAGTGLGILACDALFGFHALTPWRVFAWSTAAAVSMLLWKHEPYGSSRRQHDYSRLHYLLSALPAAWLAAAIESLGADMSKLYPFSYVFSITATHHLLWCGALAPAIFALGFQETGARRWDDVFSSPRAWRVGNVRLLILWIGALGSGISGLILSYWFHGIVPFRPYMLSVTSGPAVYAGVALFICAALAGILSPFSR